MTSRSPGAHRSAGRTAVPRLLVLTDRRQSADAGRPLVETVAAAVGAGAPAVVLREKDLPHADRRSLAAELVEVAAVQGATLLVASDPELAGDLGAGGVHLSAADPWAGRAGDRAPRDLLVGRSCHDPDEVAAAAAEGVDYVTVSPVAPTPSKPGYGPALGPAGLTRLTTVAGALPVIALGGVEPANAAGFRRAGAHGVAVMGAVMRATDPAAMVRHLLHALDEEEPR